MHKAIKMSNRIKKLQDDGSFESDIPDEGTVSKVPEPDNIDSKKADKNKKTKQRPGEILKKVREERGIAIEVVHEATKIPMDALRAIEEGYKVRTLSPFYYAGFVRMYAQFLDIDISELVEDHKKEESPEPIDNELDDIELPSWVTNLFTKERKQQIVVVAGAILVLFLLFQLISFLSSRKPRPAVQTELLPSQLRAVRTWRRLAQSISTSYT